MCPAAATGELCVAHARAHAPITPRHQLGLLSDMLVSSASEDAVDDDKFVDDLLAKEADFSSEDWGYIQGFLARLALAAEPAGRGDAQLPEPRSPKANRQQPPSPAISASTESSFGMQPPGTPRTPQQTGGVELTFEDDNLPAAGVHVMFCCMLAVQTCMFVCRAFHWMDTTARH